jgi:hypothetical protein
MNPFGKEQPPLLKDQHRHQQKMNGDSITQWAQWCIDGNAMRRPGPNGNTESDNLRTRVATEHLRESYTAFCEQRGVCPVDLRTFGKGCTRMFGQKRRLPKQANRLRPTAYDVPTAATWQERLDARFDIQKTRNGWNPPNDNGRANAG